jgi:Ca2+-binding RTX toxin-like protein
MKPLAPSALRRLAWILSLSAPAIPAAAGSGVSDPAVKVTLTRLGQNLVLSWAGANTVPYQVEAGSALTGWTNASPVLTGTGALLSFTNSGFNQTRTFFRVKRVFPAAPGSATFDPATGLLTVVADAAHNVITVANDGSGTILVNGGAITITGGVPTVSNTVLIQVLGSPIDDQISLSGALPPAHLFGAEGNDTISGGNNSDILVGGPGNDTLSGRQGSDVIYLEGGDTVIWNPGDASDVVEGHGENNTLVFNASNVGENISLSANGSRLLLFRDVGNVTLDVGGVQTVNLSMLGGADNVVVNDLTGTAVTQVNVDLASVSGGSTGDGSADTVTLNGTAGPDTFNVAANGAAVEVTGAGALVHVTNAELANDRIAFNGVGNDTVNVNGTPGADTLQITVSPVAGYVRAIGSGFTAPVDAIGALTLSVNGLGGADTISCSGGIAALGVPLVLDGGDGDDTIVGSNGSDTILGGAGNDTVSGGQGNDLVLLGDDNDTFVWNPGDGSDVVEGQNGSDTVAFNCSNVGENIALSANGSRLQLSRDVGNITMDANGMEIVNLTMLGGADNVVVNNLGGTAVTQVNVDLASTAGGSTGDAAADTVTVNGTAGPDTFNVAANGAAVEVTGAGALVHVTNAELANDRIAFNGVGNDTVNVNGTAGADTLQITVSPVAGYVRVIGSGFTAPVDVIGALTLSVNGLDGADTITAANGLAALGVPLVLDGGDGNDTISGGDVGELILGGAGDDTVSGGRGNDVVLLGDDNDTFVWNPGDGSDTVEGQNGSNTLAFNCSNVGEIVSLSANGSRLRLLRNVGNITMDANGMETVTLTMLGGADTVTVDSLLETAVTRVNVELAGVAGGSTGDGAADSVTVNGTAAPDEIKIAANAGAVEVSGLAALVRILHPELANDTLTVNGLGGTDSISIEPGVATLIGVIVNQ